MPNDLKAQVQELLALRERETDQPWWKRGEAAPSIYHAFPAIGRHYLELLDFCSAVEGVVARKDEEILELREACVSAEEDSAKQYMDVALLRHVLEDLVLATALADNPGDQGLCSDAREMQAARAVLDRTQPEPEGRAPDPRIVQREKDAI